MDINRLVRFRILRYIAPLYDRIPMRLCSTSNVRGAAKTAGPAAVIAGLLLLYYWVANNTHFPRSVNHTAYGPNAFGANYARCTDWESLAGSLVKNEHHAKIAGEKRGEHLAKLGLRRRSERAQKVPKGNVPRRTALKL